MDNAVLLKAIETLESVRVSLKVVHDSLTDTENEESADWMADGYLEEASEHIQIAMTSIDSALESALDEESQD